MQVDLSKYTEATHLRIVTYKTAFYTFYLPAAAAMHLCGIKDEAALALARDICVQLGQFFQIQDDYLDAYADPEVLGKIGTDIEDNKCSWLVVQALAKADDKQKKIIEARGVAVLRRLALARAPLAMLALAFHFASPNSRGCAFVRRRAACLSSSFASTAAARVWLSAGSRQTMERRRRPTKPRSRSCTRIWIWRCASFHCCWLGGGRVHEDRQRKKKRNLNEGGRKLCKERSAD